MTSCRQILMSELFFRFLANLGQIRKVDSSRILCKTYIFINSNLFISKIERVLLLKGIFSETTYVCVLTYQISKPHNGPLKCPHRLKLNRLSRKLLILLFLFAVLLFPFPVFLYFQNNNICIFKTIEGFSSFFFVIVIVEYNYAKMQKYFQTIVFSKENSPIPLKLLLMYFSFSAAYSSF